MAQIPTVTMWNEEGQKVIVNAGDTAKQDGFREAGYELESKIRERLPEGTEEMAMEDIITQFKEGKLKPPPPPPPQEEDKGETEGGGQGEDAPLETDMSPEGAEALDQAAGQAEPSSEEAREDTSEKPEKKRGGSKKK